MIKRKHLAPGRHAAGTPETGRRRPADSTPPQPRAVPGLWLYGHHAVLAALANPERRCRRLVMTAEARQTLGPAIDRVATGGTPEPEVAPRAEIDALLPPGAVHQGVALSVAPLPPVAVEDLAAMARQGDAAVVLVLDQVTDPHNIGAILRSAAAFGAIGVIAQDRHAPDETAVLAKAASGALEVVPLARTVNVARALDQLKAAGFWCLGLDGAAPVTIAQADLTGRIALVLGSEGTGLRRLVRERCDTLVRLPITKAVESLNVSNAAAVALYAVRAKAPDNG